MVDRGVREGTVEKETSRRMRKEEGMSMNVHVEAKRQAIVKGTGKEFTDRETFDLWQTSTDKTRQILASEKPEQAYIDHVLSSSSEGKYPVYREDDIFQEGDVIGYEIYNLGKEHVQELLTWIADRKSEGYTIEFYEM